MREGGIKEEESSGEREGERCYIYIYLELEEGTEPVGLAGLIVNRYSVWFGKLNRLVMYLNQNKW